MIDYQFTLDFEVRDYECDLQGIVNNAVYQHYLEHTRHVFLRQNGVDFTSLAERGTNLVVIRLEIDYLYPLRSRDKFFVGLNLDRLSRLRFSFLQDIYRLPDNRPIIEAKVLVTSVNENGKPCLPNELEELMESH
ncbi:acyl-CoA thioesterase [Chloroflexota bacterium]